MYIHFFFKMCGQLTYLLNLSTAATTGSFDCNTLCNALQPNPQHAATIATHTFTEPEHRSANLFVFLQHTLQHSATIATHCNTLQHNPQHTATLATHCNTLRLSATHCNTLQHTATYCNILQYNPQHTATIATHTFTEPEHRSDNLFVFLLVSGTCRVHHSLHLVWCVCVCVCVCVRV